jgi:hypothetical protein
MKADIARGRSDPANPEQSCCSNYAKRAKATLQPNIHPWPSRSFKLKEKRREGEGHQTLSFAGHTV